MPNSKKINILYFEDNKTCQIPITKGVPQIIGECHITVLSSLYRAKAYLDSALIQNYDIVITDYMFPGVSAKELLSEFEHCGKTVIFHTCISEKDFCKDCLDVLGYMPLNFKFVRKATEGYLKTITQLIQNEVA